MGPKELEVHQYIGIIVICDYMDIGKNKLILWNAHVLSSTVAFNTTTLLRHPLL